MMTKICKLFYQFRKFFLVKSMPICYKKLSEIQNYKKNGNKSDVDSVK